MPSSFAPNRDEDGDEPDNEERKDEEPHESRKKPTTSSGGPLDLGDDSSDDEDGGDKKRGPRSYPKKERQEIQTPIILSRQYALPSDFQPREPQFDTRLKTDVIPTWGGNLDKLGHWFLKINRLADRSTTIYKQLGMLVPMRLTGSAEMSYYSLGIQTRSRIKKDWGTLRQAIGDYYMNRAYIDRQKARANRASYTYNA
jgi:hypothetical protein